jgi:hypothetical protein
MNSKLDFDDIKIYTITVIVTTNLGVDLTKVGDLLPISRYSPPVRKRGRKPKNEPENVHEPNLQQGDIITLVPRSGDIKGYVKPSKKKRNSKFRNSIAINMSTGEKIVNFKITTNGKFQMTGCKNIKDAMLCVKESVHHIIEIAKTNRITLDDAYDGPLEDQPITEDGKPFEAVFFIVMNNINFNVGFKVDRDSLNNVANEVNTPYISVFENGLGYTGVNVIQKLDSAIDWDFHRLTYDRNEKNWNQDFTDYSHYLKMLKDEDRKKELKKKRKFTFLVFESGQAIMSGIHPSKMKDKFESFLSFLNTNKPTIEEKIISSV